MSGRRHGPVHRCQGFSAVSTVCLGLAGARVGRASTVAQDTWPVFYARLVDADRDLARAATMDDEDPTPHARSIQAALGLDLGQTEKHKRFGEAARRFRWHRSAHTIMIQARRPSGPGQTRRCSSSPGGLGGGPEGSGVHVVVPLAHLEKLAELAP